MERVILVDEQDNQLGTEEKIAAHQKALLHRAFSVFIVIQNQLGYELLLQQRAAHKYHCPGLWTNTCCSHPRPNEDVIAAGERRLHEEMGFSVPLQRIGVFQYKSEFDNGLTEHEIDHVLVAKLKNKPDFQLNPDEVMACQWVNLEAVAADLATNPSEYTPWFGMALQILADYLSQST